MIEVCETWEELVDWCWNKGIECKGNWGQDKTIVIKVSEYLQCPFHKIEFTKYNVCFDDKLLDFDLSPTEKHHLITMFYGRL